MTDEEFQEKGIGWSQRMGIILQEMGETTDKQDQKIGISIEEEEAVADAFFIALKNLKDRRENQIILAS